MREAAVAALRRGVDAMLQRMLPSAWTTEGRGWQEHWPEAPLAGFYASCDGLMALARARSFVPVDFDRVVDQVLAHHLTPFVTPDVPAPDERAEQQRVVVLTTTMKLAKYLQAFAASGRPHAHSRRAKEVARVLVKEGRKLKAGWSYVLGDSTPAVVPTLEALRGLHASGLDDTAVTDSARLALAAIDWRDRIAKSWTIRDLVMWVVAVCELGLVPKYVGRQQVSQCLSKLIASDEAFQHAHWFHRFVNKRAIDNDYYSANVTLQLAHTVLMLIARNDLDAMYLRLVDPIIVQIATTIATNQLFTSTDKAYFWENADALLLLAAYLNTLETITMPITSGMFVSPRFFTSTRFMYDKKLAAILMPFGTDWADDVYKAFADTISMARLKPWRADQEHKDDVIIQTIWQRINEARVVVADCTGKNPNVFYELGIAHTIGKPVFICAQDRADIPFDVASIRSHTYKVTPSGIEQLKKELAQFVEEVKKS